MSGAGERLDQLVARVLARTAFDVAVVAWDLEPAWNPREEFCRWIETVDLYRFLSESGELPEIWREKAGQRFRELSGRGTPGARSHPLRLEIGMVLPVCMEPAFESLLVQDESAVKRALGLRAEPRGWPRRAGVIRERDGLTSKSLLPLSPRYGGSALRRTSSGKCGVI